MRTMTAPLEVAFRGNTCAPALPHPSQSQTSHSIAQQVQWLPRPCLSKQRYAVPFVPDSHARTNSYQPFRLLDLPPELWSKIGRIAIDKGDDDPWWCHISKRSSEAVVAPPIAQTCRALRYELLPYYYETRVEIRDVQLDLGVELRNIGIWLMAVGHAHRACIRNVTVSVASGEAETWESDTMKIWGVDFKLVENRIRLDVGGKQTHELAFC